MASIGRHHHRSSLGSLGGLRRLVSQRKIASVATVVVAITLFAPLTTTDADTPVVTDAPAFTATKTVSRDNLVDGVNDVLDSRTVKVTVSKTQQLRDRQGITVTWSGAHPTGGLANDDTSTVGSYEEYPVVVMECRGSDSTTVPASKQVSPETCWTQTPSERFTYSQTGFLYPPWRMDEYAPTADRASDVNEPNPVPTDCPGLSGTYWVPYIAASGVTYQGGYQGCAGLAPEEAFGSVADQPGSTTYGVADVNGNGSTQFITQSDLSNASIGCSATVACTLEVIPIEGISCDAAGTAPAPGGLAPADRPPSGLVSRVQSLCTDTGQYNAGDFNTGGQQDVSPVTGQYWWSASNWRNRIAVPLTFATSSDVCNTIGSTESTALVYGAEAMQQATQQWSPSFCLNRNLFNLRHVQTSEPEAKNLLSVGNVEAAFQAAPPDTPFTTPTVQAPTAVTGFAIAFDVDGSDGKPYPQLRLDARLLAKLMTESYEACALDCLQFPALASNPIDITRDPEFQALNPNIRPSLYFSASATLALISSDSDVITALTAYINDDPEARSWLDGRPDPWGMVVNPAYEGITLPTSRWPLLDTHDAHFESGANPCLDQNQSPWLPLVASPLESPALIALNLQYDISDSQTTCQDPGNPDQKLVAVGRENQGTRFVLGLVSLADAERYDLPTAELQTQRTTDDTVVFGNANGRTFVGPTDDALKAAAAMLKPDDKLGTWSVPYDAMRTTPAGLNAYPGTLLVSTDVPTKGLDKTDAKNYSELLSFIAGAGQTPGLANGQLPPGYLPLTKANGLGALVNYTKAAAGDVLAQQCVVPHPTGAAAAAPSCNLPVTPPTSTAPTTSAAPTSASSTTPPTSTAPTTPEQTLPSNPVTTPASSAKPSVTPSSSAAPSSTPAPVSAGKTQKIGPGALGFVLPILALLALLGLGGSVLTTRGRRQ
ncbi:hypothetical protein [Jatrophihabitans sp.]|uniref:hypothetical protein n=1 Tax=Jatrophihabitans sp. TaxID=1932789 RepID=UPI0030C6A70A|nr:hypothetical protein [Jatrophihabitans sp.]